jgi:hypothetical protein
LGCITEELGWQEKGKELMWLKENGKAFLISRFLV